VGGSKNELDIGAGSVWRFGNGVAGATGLRSGEGSRFRRPYFARISSKLAVVVGCAVWGVGLGGGNGFAFGVRDRSVEIGLGRGRRVGDCGLSATLLSAA
jgi:hypothetical protein